MARFSRFPVSRETDWVRSISLSLWIPSGVSSKAQAKTRAGRKPMSNISRTSLGAHSGRPSMELSVSATWIMIQLVTT